MHDSWTAWWSGEADLKIRQDLNSGTLSQTIHSYQPHTDRLVIRGDTKYVGIGTATPSYLLHVNASYLPATVTNGLIYQTGTYLATQTASKFISIKAEQSIWTADYFLYSSDERIKKNIRDINDDIALQKILSFQPKFYNYVDITRQGEKDVIGFIAQQIEENEPNHIFFSLSCYINIIIKFRLKW